MTVRSRGLVAAGLATVVLVGCTDDPLAPERRRSLGLPLDAAAAQDVGQFEVPYMKQTIDHHAMGVMMATMCTGKAVHAELIALCEANRTHQQQEIQQLQAWLLAWYGISYTPRMQPGDERMMERMMALPAAEFEMEFLEMFSQHHWVIIHRSIPIARNAVHAELQALAESVITNQYEDVEMMREWLCDWYSRCLPVPPLPAAVT